MSIVEAISLTIPCLIGIWTSFWVDVLLRNKCPIWISSISSKIPFLIGSGISLIAVVLSEPITIRDFTLTTSPTPPNEFVLEYTGPKPLTDIDMIVSIRLVNGESSEIKRFWATWKTDESKTVPVEITTPAEKWEIHGKARSEGRRAIIDAVFRAR